MLCVILASAAVVLILFTIAATNVDSGAPHVDDEHDWFIKDYLPLDPDLDGDITDED